MMMKRTVNCSLEDENEYAFGRTTDRSIVGYPLKPLHKLKRGQDDPVSGDKQRLRLSGFLTTPRGIE